MKSRKAAVGAWLDSKGGVWYPAVRWVLDQLYRHLSLGHGLNRLLEGERDRPWVSELYQLVVLIIGLVWLSLTGQPTSSRGFWITVFGFVALYRPLEIVLFGMHWLLVAERPVQAYRRSLIGFFLNLCELAIFFAIAFMLFGVLAASWHSALLQSLTAVFTLSSVGENLQSGMPQILARTQVVAVWILVVLIVANVVGAIDRGEKGDGK